MSSPKVLQRLLSFRKDMNLDLPGTSLATVSHWPRVGLEESSKTSSCSSSLFSHSYVVGMAWVLVLLLLHLCTKNYWWFLCHWLTYPSLRIPTIPTYIISVIIAITQIYRWTNIIIPAVTDGWPRFSGSPEATLYLSDLGEISPKDFQMTFCATGLASFPLGYHTHQSADTKS